MAKPDAPKFQLPPHPSGRPKERNNFRALGFRRLPPDEPLTPGLRRLREHYEIGFHRGLYLPDDGEEN